MLLVDTHAHLAFPDFADEIPALLERAEKAGVRDIVVVGTTVDDSARSLDLARERPSLHVSVGVHPHEADAVTPAGLALIERLAADPRVRAVGETGLDYVKRRATPKAQRELFEWHVDLARRSRKTLVVHNRGADDDCRSVLASLDASLPLVLHCFSSDGDMLRWALDRNCFISVAGQVTYPNAGDLRSVVAQVPADRLLFETDCPFLTPQPRRSRVRHNEPAFVEYTARAVAELRGVSVEDLAQATTGNACRAFGLPRD